MRYIAHCSLAGITRGGLRRRLRRRCDAAFVRATHPAREAVRVGREPRDPAAPRLLLRRRRAAGRRRGGRGSRALAASAAAQGAAAPCCVITPVPYFSSHASCCAGTWAGAFVRCGCLARCLACRLVRRPVCHLMFAATVDHTTVQHVQCRSPPADVAEQSSPLVPRPCCRPLPPARRAPAARPRPT